MFDPEDPLTQLAAAAAQLHEVFQAHIEAGFTEQQALELVKTILLAGMGA
ncbi:hypothetical protein [Streptomyces sp. NPDC008150]